ncbi:MAG: alpha-L-fucosidase [Eubacteriales bacterium]|nr:alpha-L-fucosidase [Eubacteriales bacterium]
MESKWYSKSYRRNLVDMHIEDWDPRFLSEFSAEAYLENLKKAHIQSPMIYLQSHAGHCYFPTKSGHMHASLEGHENYIKKLIDLCHAEGMDVVGYYSLIYNTWAEDKHPEWRIRTGEDGLSARQKGGRYGHCCPNNMEYRAFVLEQIKEMAEYFKVEGMFYDMLFWPALCNCDHCRERLKEETGIAEIPVKPDWYDPTWKKYMDRRRSWMGEFAMWAATETKRLMPGVSVEHNYASAVAGEWQRGSDESVNESCDYAGGDLYGDLYNHSFTAKYYRNVTRNQPFEYMTCRCDSNLSQHTITKSEEALTVEVMLTAAHHGASFIIDAIDPVGTLDARVYDRIGRVFEKQMIYEPYFKGDMIEDTAVYYSTSGRYNRDGQDFTSKTCSVNLVKTLVMNNIPAGVISHGCTDRLKEFSFVFAPSIAGLSKEQGKNLSDYVKNGGTLYISGTEEESLIADLAGIRFREMTKENRTYIAPVGKGLEVFGEFNEKYPLPVFYKLPVVGTDSREGILAYIKLPYTVPGEKKFASIHSNPPGIMTEYPALIVRKCGKGTVIWSAAPIENDPRLAFRQIMINIFRMFVKPGDQTLSSSAPRQVEVVGFKTPDSYLVSAVDLLFSNEKLRLDGFDVSVKTGARPVSVKRIGDAKNMPFDYENGRAVFRTEPLMMFDMYEIKV